MSAFPFHLIFGLSLFLFFFPALLRAEELRTWTSTDGKTIRAELVDVLNGEAVLKIPNRPSNARVAVIRLSPADQEYVKSWKKPDPAPPVPGKDSEKGAKEGGKKEESTDAGGFPIGKNSTVKRNKAGWPEVVALKERPSFTVVEEDKKAEKFVYRSDHFEFTTTNRLSGDIVREFSRLFETTYEAVVSLPLRLDPKPPNGFFQVKLFSTTEDYFASGGMAGSGGMYSGRTREVMVPLPYLGVKKIGERWVMEDREGNHTLVHEVTHQVMHDWLIYLPVWVVEGAAEYLTAGRYAPGRLTLRGYGKNMQEYKAGGSASRTLKIRDLEKLMVMDDRTWAGALAGDGASLNYRTSMLLFYYFCHEDGDGSGQFMIDYFKARKDKKNYGDDKEEREEYLLRGRDAATLQRDFKKGLASAGVRIDD